jgi:hypothetical protein
MQKFTAVLLAILVHIAALEAKLKAVGVKFRALLVDAHMQSWADAEDKAEAKIEARVEAYSILAEQYYTSVVKAREAAAAISAGKAAAAVKHGA